MIADFHLPCCPHFELCFDRKPVIYFTQSSLSPQQQPYYNLYIMRMGPMTTSQFESQFPKGQMTQTALVFTIFPLECVHKASGLTGTMVLLFHLQRSTV